ncbi:hypothetical protein ACU4HD_10545 [Cupriavidus basilensis]
MVTDGFLRRGGLIDPALADLKAKGWQVTLIDDVIADPPEQIVVDAGEPCKVPPERGGRARAGGGGSRWTSPSCSRCWCLARRRCKTIYGVKAGQGAGACRLGRADADQRPEPALK